MSKIDQDKLTKILYHVEKPGRYVGGEHNQIRKDWNSVDTHIALVFPDIYDLGQPNLGLAILYDILNKQANVVAERCFAPWQDMEESLRQEDIPLFSLESKTPLSDFDIVGISLPYESIYTNALNILDLAKIPVLSSQRKDAHPLVLAGGQACYNPEPMVDFIDAFVIGEGEEVILEIIQCHEEWRKSELSRSFLLKSLSEIKGVYVPSLYQVDYLADGPIANIQALEESLPQKITKRITAQLPPALTKLIVPNVEIVHDRIPIEIMRGCTRGCRFCHAGTVNRPVRQRDIPEILHTINEALAATGYEEVSLLSLSSSDHTQILELVESIYETFKDKKVFVSLPSLRIASFSVELMDKLKDLRPGGGFTLAPEAATERMRAIINKPLDDEVLFETVKTVFEHGWLSLKLYYMIGLPEETLEDVQAIIEVAKKIKQIGKQIVGNRVRIHLGVATFIPKPHTPFQWYPVSDPESIQQKLDLLKQGARKAGVKLTYNLPESTLLEAWLSRGDRRLGQVIYAAWKNGAKFDAWGEKFNREAWLSAFAESGLDPDFYTYRERSIEEILPWDHISSGVKKSFLIRDLNSSKSGKTREDCRNQCFYCGILDAFGDIRPNPAEIYWGCSTE